MYETYCYSPNQFPVSTGELNLGRQALTGTLPTEIGLMAGLSELCNADRYF